MTSNNQSWIYRRINKLIFVKSIQDGLLDVTNKIFRLPRLKCPGKNQSYVKGQIISKCLFEIFKRTKTCRIEVKTNSFVHFLEEFAAWQFAFEISWPLVDVRSQHIHTLHFCILIKHRARIKLCFWDSSLGTSINDVWCFLAIYDLPSYLGKKASDPFMPSLV